MSAVKIKCPDCGHMFSENALMCPKCGCPTARAIKENKSKGCFGTTASIIGAIAIIGLILDGKSPSNTSNVSSTSVSSEQVEYPVKSTTALKETELKKDVNVKQEPVTSTPVETDDVIIDEASVENTVSTQVDIDTTECQENE
jgi:uncharacterized OB-fold protein